MSNTNHNDWFNSLPACENTEHLLHQSPHICREYWGPPTGEPPTHSVPEPGALALFLPALLALAWLRRRAK